MDIAQTVHDEGQEQRFRLEFAGRASIEQAKLIRKLLKETDKNDHTRRAQLHSKLSAALYRTERKAALAAAQSAVDEAAKTDDDVAEAWALLAQCAVDLSPARTQYRLTSTRRIREIAMKYETTSFFEPAFFMLLGALLELGKINELDLELSTHGPTLSYFPQLEETRHVSWLRYVRALIDGDPVQAERFVQEGYERANVAEDHDAQFVLMAQMSMLRWLQGRGIEMESSFLKGRQLYPDEAVWTSGLAWVWATQGRHSAAKGLVESLGTVETWNPDRNWLVAACILAEAYYLLGETDGAQALYEELLPYHERLAHLGAGVSLWGPVARSLAILATLLGEPDEALQHYRTSLNVCAKIGAQAWLVESLIDLARLLIDQDQEGNSQEAIKLLTEAATTSRTLELHSFADTATQLLDSLGSGLPDTAEPTPQPQSHQASINVLGGFEVTAANNESTIWQSRKAREALKILVSRRGVAIAKERMMDILWPNEHPRKLANRFSVALSTIRRTLDPEKRFPADHFLAIDSDLVRLRLENLVIDVEQFIRQASYALAERDNSTASLLRMEHAFNLYTGEAFPEEEPDVLWAERMKIEAHSMFFTLAHAFAEDSAAKGNHFNRVEAYRRILEADPFDQRAHEGLIEAFTQMGALGQAAAAKTEFHERMKELGVERPD